MMGGDDMTDAPERIWAWRQSHLTRWSTHGGGRDTVEYIRADLARLMTVAEAANVLLVLENAERKLQDAADYWDELCNDDARAPFTDAANQARAALHALSEGESDGKDLRIHK